jgi:hypothetical protein
MSYDHPPTCSDQTPEHVLIATPGSEPQVVLGLLAAFDVKEQKKVSARLHVRTGKDRVR